MAMDMTANGRCGEAALPRRRSARQRGIRGQAARQTEHRRAESSWHEDSYSTSNSSTQVFDMAFLKIDSDQADGTEAWR